MQRVTILALATLLVVGLTSCSHASSNDKPLTDRLSNAKQSLDEATYIGFKLTSNDLPGGVNVLKSAHGTGTHAPAFTGSVEVLKGLDLNLDLVAVGSKVYADLPFVSWTSINPADYGAPDPAALMSRSTGLSSLLTDTVDARTAGSQRRGSEVLTKVDGTLPGKDVHALFPSSALSGFTVSFLLSDDDVLESVTITGPFYGDHGTSSYSIDLDLSAAPVTITAPQ